MGAVPKPAELNRPALPVLEQFLFHEARLLDEQRWDEWSALFTEDGTYWVPATPGQPDPLNHVSLIYENKLLREVRIRRYSHPNAFSLQPTPRSVHLVSNVMLDHFDQETGEVTVNSRFVMIEYRRDVQMVYGGAYTHTLMPSDDSFRIKQKKVELLNCDAALENIQIYF